MEDSQNLNTQIIDHSNVLCLPRRIYVLHLLRDMTSKRIVYDHLDCSSSNHLYHSPNLWIRAGMHINYTSPDNSKQYSNHKFSPLFEHLHIPFLQTVKNMLKNKEDSAKKISEFHQ